jgi:hypothetical protein
MAASEPEISEGRYEADNPKKVTKLQFYGNDYWIRSFRADNLNRRPKISPNDHI